MLKNIKGRELSYNHFLDAVTACEYPDRSKYFKQQLSLVGVYYGNPLESKILAEPVLEVMPSEDNVGLANIVLEPDNNQREGLDILNLVLHQAGIGVIIKDNTNVIDDLEYYYDVELADMKDYFSRNTIMEQVNDYGLAFVVTEDKVEQKRYKINGVQYYAYTLYSKGKVGEEEYTQTLTALFKDKQYDGETFLTQFIDEDIGKADGVKLLDTIANENLSSQAVGTVSFESNKEPSFNGFSVAFTSPTELHEVDGVYSFETLETRIVFKREDIVGVQVTMVDNKSYYVLAVITKHNTLNIFMS